MFNIDKAVVDIYMKMGNLKKSQVDLGVILSLLHSVTNRRLVEFNLSTTNWIINYLDVYPTGEYRNPLAITDFSNAVSVEIDYEDDGFQTYGKDIEIINPLNVNQAQKDGRRAIGFYQNSDEGNWYYVTSFNDWDGTMRIWYEPDSPAPKSLSGVVGINEIFMSMITSEVGAMGISYVTGMDRDTKQSVQLGLERDTAKWEIKWEEQLQKGRQNKISVRRPFRAGY